MKSTPRLSNHLNEIFTKVSRAGYYISDEDPPPHHWDWPGWLLPGFLTILAGQPDSGKSSLCLHLAAAYHESRPWPDGAPFTASPGKTLWVEHNDDPRIHLARLRNWGINQAHLVTSFFNLPYPEANSELIDPQDLSRLTDSANHPDIRLIVLDSLDGLLACANTPRLIHDLLTTFTRIARFLKKPILLTHTLHQPPTFDRGRRLNLSRLLSPEISQVPCAIWCLDLPDPAHPTHRRLSVIKNNLAAYPDPLSFRIDDQGLHFGQPSHHSQEALARTFLKNHLAAGPLPVTQIMAAADAAGLARPTLRRAKKHLSIQSNKQPNQWTWQLPLDN